MQYSPKLKKAMAEIKKVLEKHDIAACVVLHTPRFSEYLLSLSPSYSCAKFDGEQIKINARLQEDFGGKRNAQIFKVQNTSNMMRMLAETSTHLSLSLMEMSELLDSKIDADHTEGGHSTETTQNN